MYHGEFDQLLFSKTGAEVKEQARKKIAKLDKRLEERKAFLTDLVAEAKVENAVDALIDLDALLQTARHSAKMPAEARSRLQSVVDKIAEERKEKKLLQLVERNLSDEATFNLKFPALRYFEF